MVEQNRHSYLPAALSAGLALSADLPITGCCAQSISQLITQSIGSSAISAVSAISAMLVEGLVAGGSDYFGGTQHSSRPISRYSDRPAGATELISANLIPADLISTNLSLADITGQIRSERRRRQVSLLT